MTGVGDQGSHLLYIPDVVLVSEAFHRFTGFRIAPVSQLAVRRHSAAPLLIRSLVKPLMQRRKVDFENKDGVEQVDELREVA